MRYTITSLFSGCGGLDLGFIGGFEYKGERFRRLPFDIVGAFDNDQKSVHTYANMIGDHILMKDLATTNPSEIPPADILIGGFPCQDFSSCGPKRGLRSSRGRLYEVMVDYLSHHQPMTMIAENVRHLAKMHGGTVLKTILEAIRQVGYRVEVWSLNAADFGVPQTRKRLFIVAVREDLPGFPAQPLSSHADSPNSIEWAIRDLEKITDESIPNQSQYFLASTAKRGNGQGDEKSRRDLPGYTVRANAKSRIQFHYVLPRRLTVRECARLQTFPDSFVFEHSATSNIMQIGNAVPPVLAYRVAQTVKRYLDSIHKNR
ncbi:MAG: DNA (cytosine-5-)-methyltransferase [bacterium]|nr:DNA (cytosine-5-)-methyltransferase [bacterium]MBK8130658.1 DNA (cytosine-5-)-methyltransferase [bacterium]